MKKLLIAATIAVASMSSYAAFTAGMDAAQVKTEVETQKNSGKTADEIAAAAFAVGISAETVASALKNAGFTQDAVRPGLVKAGYDADLVVDAIVGAFNGDREAVKSSVNNDATTFSKPPTDDKKPGTTPGTTTPSSGTGTTTPSSGTGTGGGGGTPVSVR